MASLDSAFEHGSRMVIQAGQDGQESARGRGAQEAGRRRGCGGCGRETRGYNDVTARPAIALHCETHAWRLSPHTADRWTNPGAI
jgi:hypothetical protein